LQMRVNRRTAQYQAMIQEGEVEGSRLKPEIQQLGEREERIENIARDIVQGKNQ